jgi:hypothetical protein
MIFMAVGLNNREDSRSEGVSFEQDFLGHCFDLHGQYFTHPDHGRDDL